MQINERVRGGTGILALLGNPVSHSISPQLHNTISDILGLDTVYIAMRVDRDGLGAAVAGLRACNLIGFNITVPYKEAVVEFCDKLSEDVLLMGSANTVKNINGVLCAYNTDASGLIRALRLQMGTEVKGRKIAVLGAGGTARSVSVKLAMEGAGEIFIVNRTKEKSDHIADLINTKIGNIVCSMRYDEAYENKAIESCDLVINTTSLGLYPKVDECPLHENFRFRSSQLVYDAIYKPARTKLMKLAEACGCKTANGLGMLVCQGVEAYEIWMDRKIDDDMVRQLYQTFLKFYLE